MHHQQCLQGVEPAPGLEPGSHPYQGCSLPVEIRRLEPRARIERACLGYESSASPAMLTRLGASDGSRTHVAGVALQNLTVRPRPLWSVLSESHRPVLLGRQMPRVLGQRRLKLIRMSKNKTGRGGVSRTPVNCVPSAVPQSARLHPDKNQKAGSFDPAFGKIMKCYPSRVHGSSRAILLACGRVPCGSVPNWIACIIANFILMKLHARVKRRRRSDSNRYALAVRWFSGPVSDQLLISSAWSAGSESN